MVVARGALVVAAWGRGLIESAIVLQVAIDAWYGYGLRAAWHSTLARRVGMKRGMYTRLIGYGYGYGYGYGCRYGYGYG